MEILEGLITALSFVTFLSLSAFYSSSETACTAINPVKIRSLLEANQPGAKQLARLFEHPKQLLTGIIVGSNIANVAASAIATNALLKIMASLNLGLNIAIELAIVTVIVTALILFIGEITPKTIAIKHPTTFALRISKPLRFSHWLLYPLIIIVSKITHRLSNIFSLSSSESTRVLSQEDIKTTITMAEEEGLLEEEEKEMINSIFSFGDKVVREIMTPRTDAICIHAQASLADVTDLIIEKGHSRIPIYEDKVDNILGIVYAKDLLHKSTNTALKAVCRDATFIPETKNIEELLSQMKQAQFHMAIVVDEHGGMSGIVTLEDIIEEILGEIEDEYDAKDASPMLRQLTKNTFVTDAKINIDTIQDKLNIALPQDDDYDTLGGFILSLLGRFPEKGETIIYNNLSLTIKGIQKNRITKIEIHVRPQSHTDQ